MQETVATFERDLSLSEILKQRLNSEGSRGVELAVTLKHQIDDGSHRLVALARVRLVY
jgi:hypothetical protein